MYIFPAVGVNVQRHSLPPPTRRRFHALLSGNKSMSRRLLAGSGSNQLALVAPMGNFTVLHAAVAARMTAILPHVVALCAAAGMPVDAEIHMQGGCLTGWRRFSPMWRQLSSVGGRSPYDFQGLEHQSTALSIAVW